MGRASASAVPSSYPPLLTRPWGATATKPKLIIVAPYRRRNRPAEIPLVADYSRQQEDARGDNFDDQYPSRGGEGGQPVTASC